MLILWPSPNAKNVLLPSPITRSVARFADLLFDVIAKSVQDTDLRNAVEAARTHLALLKEKSGNRVSEILASRRSEARPR